MRVYSIMKTLGSGKVGYSDVKSNDSMSAVRIRFIQDARLFYKVFGREKAITMLKDTVYSTDRTTFERNYNTEKC